MKLMRCVYLSVVVLAFGVCRRLEASAEFVVQEGSSESGSILPEGAEELGQEIGSVQAEVARVTSELEQLNAASTARYQEAKAIRERIACARGKGLSSKALELAEKHKQKRKEYRQAVEVAMQKERELDAVRSRESLLFEQLKNEELLRSNEKVAEKRIKKELAARRTRAKSELEAQKKRFEKQLAGKRALMEERLNVEALRLEQVLAGFFADAHDRLYEAHEAMASEMKAGHERISAGGGTKAESGVAQAKFKRLQRGLTEVETYLRDKAKSILGPKKAALIGRESSIA